MTVASASASAPAPAPSAAGAAPAAATSPRIGHALAVGAAGFAWCSLALGLSTAGVMNAAAAR